MGLTACILYCWCGQCLWVQTKTLSHITNPQLTCMVFLPPCPPPLCGVDVGGVVLVDRYVTRRFQAAHFHELPQAIVRYSYINSRARTHTHKYIIYIYINTLCSRRATHISVCCVFMSMHAFPNPTPNTQAQHNLLFSVILTGAVSEPKFVARK